MFSSLIQSDVDAKTMQANLGSDIAALPPGGLGIPRQTPPGWTKQ
jgi:hypothetical protein